MPWPPPPTVPSTPPAEAPARASRGDRFVATGLLVLVALFVVVQLMAGEVIAPLAVPAVIYAALGAVFLRWSHRWLLIGLLALLAVHLITSIPFLAASLAHPETPAGFVPDALILIVVAMVAAGAVMALRRPQASRRRLPVVAALVGVAAVAASAVAASGVTAEARQNDDVAVLAQDAQYPDRLQAPAQEATFWIENEDPIRHTFLIEGTDVQVEVPGSTAVRVATDLAPGTYRYYCDVPGHEGMEGELVVR